MNLSQRLLKEMKTSAPKTGVLALLLLVGLYFWIPPLVRAFGTTPTTPAVASTTSISGAQSNPERTDLTKTSPKKHDSAAIVRLMKECPQLQPANIDDLPTKPFGIDDEQFPLPVLFADESEAELHPKAAVEEKKPVEKLDGLVLKSTILSAQRRAAWINNRLYQEGQAVLWNKVRLRLTNIQSKSVTLTDGSNEWELKLDDKQNSNNKKSVN